ncbi:hypothetical protein M2263_002817 [Providencia alcalifaciens]|nr:hypothetical protein [Providencia alcalifaciens]
MKKREGQRVSAEINIDLTLSCEVHCFIGIAQLASTNERKFTIEGKNSFDISLMGAVRANSEVNVFSMKAAFNFDLELKTSAFVALESHKNGIDLVICHDGIVLALALSADIKKVTKGRSRSNNKYQTKPKGYELYDIADPLKLEESDLRFNLSGEKKNVPKRLRQRLQMLPKGTMKGLMLKY